MDDVSTISNVSHADALSMDSLPDGSGGSQLSVEYRTLVGRLKQWVEDPHGDTKDLHLCMVKLRACNRSISLQVRNRRKRVQQAKNAIDRTELTRQNLLYQKNHLNATIEDTRRHESLYLSITLEPIDDAMDLDEHQLAVQQLKNELEARRQLSDCLKAKQESLELAKSRLVLKRKELEKLRDQLESIIKCTETLCSSNSRLFVEFTQRTEANASDDVLKSEPSQNNCALETLFQNLLAFAETEEGISLYHFDEVEAGEEEEEQEEDLVADDVEETMGTPVTETKSGHNRFASHTGNNGNKKGRKYQFAHIVVEMQGSDEPAFVYFFPIAGESLIGVQIEIPSLGLRAESKAEVESFLLSLPLEPALLLTSAMSSETAAAAGEAGFVPFRWIQCLSGAAPQYSSCADAQSVLKSFFTAIKSKIDSNNSS